MNSLQVEFSVNIDEAQIQDWERELQRNACGKDDELKDILRFSKMRDLQKFS